MTDANEMRQVLANTLSEIADTDDRIVVLEADLMGCHATKAFKEAHPDRFFDVGIAEGHGVAMAGGMAKQGLIPVFAVYDSFLQRGYDMLVQDMALEKLHGVLAVDRCGLVGADGETHHGCLDYLSQIPGMTVLAPASFAELRRMLRRAVLDMTTGPVAVRYPRGGEDGYDGDCGDEPVTVLRQGTDAAIVTYGILTGQALRAAELLEKEGVSLRVVKLNRVAPLDGDGICRALDGVKRVVAAEDQLRAGAVGERLGALLLERGAGIERYALRNAGEALPAQGSTAQLRHVLGLDAEGMAQAVREVLK